MAVFSAKIQTGGAYGPFHEDVTVKYDTLITNVGDAYSPSTGVFTAPFEALYFFTFFYRAGGEHAGNLELIKNQEVIVKASDHHSGGTSSGGNAVFLLLQKGDEVCVRMRAGAHVWADDGHTTFSGHLVKE